MQTKFTEFAASFRDADLFHSARLKLTAFYFATLVVFCVVLSVSAHEFIEHELDRGVSAQQGVAGRLFQQYGDQGDSSLPSGIIPFGNRYFTNAVRDQSQVTRQNLTRDLVLIDVALLAVAAYVSYWYAGRTLKPIEEAHEQQKRFTSDASHELRTPLASMKLENEVFLRQKTFSEKDARELIASNLEEVGRLDRLATNLLALNRYEHGDMSHAVVPVREMVDAAIERVRKGRAAHKVRFVQDIVPATVDINRESLTELLTLLLDNAVKYGGKDGTVEVGGMLADETYIVTVRDHGPGIAEDDLPHLFERMYRGDKARSSKVPGHGIGLSLARQIAEVNDAQLTAANAPGGGAVFTLTLS